MNLTLFKAVNFLYSQPHPLKEKNKTGTNDQSEKLNLEHVRRDLVKSSFENSFEVGEGCKDGKEKKKKKEDPKVGSNS